MIIATLYDAHVLMTFASRDEATHALASFEIEGISPDLLRIEAGCVPPASAPRGVVYWISDPARFSLAHSSSRPPRAHS